MYKGAESATERQESKLLNIFLKGKKKQKEELEANHLCNPLFPSKYIFYLLCCYQPNCIHPVCQRERCDPQRCWYSSRPNLKFVPIPTPDPLRPYGGQCEECKDLCAGHFMKPDKLIEHYNLNGVPHHQM